MVSKSTGSLPGQIALAGLLVLFVVACRYWIDIPNFQPVMAVALFAGMILQSRWLAVSTVLAGMILSDWLIGMYEGNLMLVVYLAVSMPLVCGWWIRQLESGTKTRFGLLAGSAAVSAVVFYLVTNWGVWMFSAWYPPGIGGLVTCMAMGLPFFKWTLAGNILFAGMLFGGHAVLQGISRNGLTRSIRQRSPATVPVRNR